MDFLEDLPDDCPIDKAKNIEVPAAYRIVSSMTPVLEDFYSNAKLNIPRAPVVDPCRFASCSLFGVRSKAIEIAAKLPKVRIANPHISLCSIKPEHGVSYVNKKKHVDFWPYASFQPKLVVVKTEKVDG